MKVSHATAGLVVWFVVLGEFVFVPLLRSYCWTKRCKREQPAVGLVVRCKNCRCVTGPGRLTVLAKTSQKGLRSPPPPFRLLVLAGPFAWTINCIVFNVHKCQAHNVIKTSTTREDNLHKTIFFLNSFSSWHDVPVCTLSLLKAKNYKNHLLWVMGQLLATVMIKEAESMDYWVSRTSAFTCFFDLSWFQKGKNNFKTVKHLNKTSKF